MHELYFNPTANWTEREGWGINRALWHFWGVTGPSRGTLALLGAPLPFSEAPGSSRRPLALLGGPQVFSDPPGPSWGPLALLKGP